MLDLAGLPQLIVFLLISQPSQMLKPTGITISSCFAFINSLQVKFGTFLAFQSIGRASPAAVPSSTTAVHWYMKSNPPFHTLMVSRGQTLPNCQPWVHHVHTTSHQYCFQLKISYTAFFLEIKSLADGQIIRGSPASILSCVSLLCHCFNFLILDILLSSSLKHLSLNNGLLQSFCLGRIYLQELSA